MKRFFRSIPWKSILLITLVTALGIGAIVGIGKAVARDDKTISSFGFERGGIDANGVYVDTNKSIVTKDLIECQGLCIEPNSETTGKFQVFYYYFDKSYAGSTDIMNASDGMYEKNDSFESAKYCRIVITPDASKNSNGQSDKSFAIAFYEVIGYANDFTIIVDKKQDFDKAGLFEEGDLSNRFIEFIPASGDSRDDYVFGDKIGYSVSKGLNVVNIEELKVVFPRGTEFNFIFVNSTDGNFGDPDTTSLVSYGDSVGENGIIRVPDGATHFICTYKTGSDIGIYKVK